MASLRPFLAIFVPAIIKSFTKPRFRRLFWGPDTKPNKSQKQKCKCIFFHNIEKNRNRNICILSYNFWTNHDLDLFSTSKWKKNWIEMVEKWLLIMQHLFFHYRRVLILHLLVFNLWSWLNAGAVECSFALFKIFILKLNTEFLITKSSTWESFKTLGFASMDSFFGSYGIYNNVSP